LTIFGDDSRWWLLMDDQYWMKLALAEAEAAFEAGEVPVGCVIVAGDQILSRGQNQVVRLGDPTAHAESLAIRQAMNAGRFKVAGATLYVTMEPCLMCAGAILLARLGRVVYGCDDPKGGAARSLYTALSDERLNHLCKVTPGVLAQQASDLLSSFFEELRNRR
jgi:tRNA(adenine34) deaminase